LPGGNVTPADIIHTTRDLFFGRSMRQNVSLTAKRLINRLEDWSNKSPIPYEILPGNGGENDMLNVEHPVKSEIFEPYCSCWTIDNVTPVM